jgi:aminopeptidase N
MDGDSQQRGHVLRQDRVQVSRMAVWLLLANVLSSGCNSGGSGESQSVLPDASIDWERDILLTSLDIDVESMTARADVVLAGSSSSSGASFEVGDLIITNVTLDGMQLRYTTELNRLDVGVPLSDESQTLSIEYSFNLHDNQNGVLENGVTFTWPYYCGNVFPCRSEPAEGSHYQVMISGIPSGSIGIYPQSVSADMPAYALAWAIGDYRYHHLGVTTNGTEVGIYYFADQQRSALLGTQYLVDVFDWYEQTYGEYLFGSRVASVAVNWVAGDYGGMEHHPFWHIASGSLSDPLTHVHEAAHGWFGNGVRIACWEDFTLSEGLTSYLAARGMTEVAGEAYGEQIWSTYEDRLNRLQSGSENKIAWPQGCNGIDILEDELFGTAPYMKGAFFFKHLEQVLGREELDSLLASFYAENRGKATTVQEMLNHISENSPYDPQDCAQAWLRTEFLPENHNCRYE